MNASRQRHFAARTMGEVLLKSLGWSSITRRVWTLLKAAHHKYLRKVPTGRFTEAGRPIYRYYYKVTGGRGLSHDEFKVGAAFQFTHDGQVGHFHVKAVDGDRLTIEHDETRHTTTITRRQFAKMLHDEHSGAARLGNHRVAGGSSEPPDDSRSTNPGNPPTESTRGGGDDGGDDPPDEGEVPGYNRPVDREVLLWVQQLVQDPAHGLTGRSVQGLQGSYVLGDRYSNLLPVRLEHEIRRAERVGARRILLAPETLPLLTERAVEGKVIWAVGVSGEVYICQEKRRGVKINHPILLARQEEGRWTSGEALAVGEAKLRVEVDGGVMCLDINNSSGHYKPHRGSLELALAIIQRTGARVRIGDGVR